MALAAPSRCRRHRAAAGWRCLGCGPLCPDCTFLKPAGTATVDACGLCGGLVDRITVHRATAASYLARLPSALGYPLTRSGLLAIAAFAAVMRVLGWLGIIGWLLGLGVYWGYLFSLIRASSRGSSAIEAPDLSDVFDDLIVPAFRGVVATAVLWVPSVLYLGSRLAEAGPRARPLDALLDPVLALVLAASIAYVPMALMMAALGAGTLRMLNPLAVVVNAWRLGGDYALAVAAVVALALVHASLAFAGGIISTAPIPIVPGWVAECLALYAPIVMARVLGLLLFLRGDAVDLGHPSDYLEPVLPGVAPRGAPVVLSIEPPPDERSRPFDPIAVEPIAVEPEPESPAAAIGRAIVADDLGRAMELYRAAAAPLDALAPAHHFSIAKAAALGGDFALAVEALQAAAAQEGPVAPGALLVLGRLYARRLSQPALAEATFRSLLERYPGSSAAQAAELHLAGR